MDAKNLLKLTQSQNRGNACDRLLESLESPPIPSQFAQGYGADGYVVVGLDGSVKQAQYQSNTAIASGRVIAATGNPGSAVIIDQQPRRDLLLLEPPAIIEIGGLLALIVNYTTDLYNRVGIGPYIQISGTSDLNSTLEDVGDTTIIWADSNRKWYGLHIANSSPNKGDLVWFNGRSTTYLNEANAIALGKILNDYENLTLNHFVQGVRGETVSGPLDLTHYFFNLRNGRLTTHASSGIYAPPSVSGGTEEASISVTGTVKIFADLELPAALNINYDYEETEEEIDGPWPIPGQIVSYHFFRHPIDNNSPPTYAGGLSWTPGADRCADGYFCVYRAAFNSQNAIRWLGSVPCPSGYTVQSPYLYTAGFGNHFQTVYSDLQANNPIPNVQVKMGGTVEYRDGNLGSFTLINVFDPIQELIIKAVYPNPPVIPPVIHIFRFGADIGGNDWALVYSDIDPCLDPRPYTRTRSRKRYTMQGDRYQPLARNDRKVLYLEAKNIDYSRSNVTAPAFGDLAEPVDETLTTWAADYRCVIQDLATEAKTEVTAYQPITLPFPNIDNPEIGAPYTFNYSSFNGWAYKKFCPAPNNGNRRLDNDPDEDISGVAPEWKAWFSAIVAAGDIPIFGKTYGNSTARPGSKSVQIFKGRITSIAYNDSITDISDLNIFNSDDDNSWPVQFESFTLVFDEFLVELADTQFVDGVYFQGYVDLFFVNAGSGPAPNFGGIAILDTGSVLNAGLYAYSDTAYDLANALSITGIQASLERPDRPFQGQWLYQSNTYTLNFGQIKWEWRSRRNGAEELYVHYRDYGQDSNFSFMAYKLDNLIFPVLPNNKFHTLQPVFKIVTDPNTGLAGVFFDRIELIANDVKRSDVTGNIYSFPDSTIIPID